MQFQLLGLALAAVASAAPSAAVAPTLCPNGAQALCCTQTVGAGIFQANCQDPGPRIKTLKQFSNHCTSKGYVAECCTMDFDGYSWLCNPAS